MKLLITLLVGSITSIGIAILRDDPLREGNHQNEQAIEKVKSFAVFVQSKPEIITHLENNNSRYYRTHETTESDSNLVNLGADVFEELINADHQSARDELKQKILKNPDVIYSYIKNKAETLDTERNDNWYKTMQGLKIFTELGHDEALEQFASQLISARSDPDSEIRNLAETWYKTYLSKETNPERLKTVQEEYEQRAQLRHDELQRKPAQSLPDYQSNNH